MKFSCTLIAVKDINASRQFYENLFNLKVEFDFGINIAFDCGLALQQDFDWLTTIPKSEIAEKSNNFELCFEEEDFDGFLVKLKAYPNMKYVHDVIEHSWGQRVIRFYDIDNHLIEVGESMKTVVNRFLSQGQSMEDIAKIMDTNVESVQLFLK